MGDGEAAGAALRAPDVQTGSDTSSVGPVISKPRNDEHEYQFVTLENGLRVVLVSDPTCDKAAASMDVCVGSLCDPKAFPGLAHFTEHMLFYSSARYPEEDAYSKFISDHGGRTNAYTAAEATNYHFDVNAEHLEAALDRFAQFFICPLISEDGVDREVRAVDSEHGKNLSSDVWRKMQLYRHALANTDHPWARFATGNRDTLFLTPKAQGLDPRQAVVDFHTQHYSADRMVLCVVGRQPLPELQALVARLFSEVPNKALPRPTFSANVFPPAEDPRFRNRLLRMVPIREGQSLELVWAVPPSVPQYKSVPLGYLSHLLGHEGSGSIFAALKAAGLASGLVAGESGSSLSSVSFFYVSIDLTEEGQRRLGEVGALVFKYLALLRAPGGINHDTWEEVRSLAELHFHTRDKPQPYSAACSLSSAAHDYPPQDLLLALYNVPQVYDADAIRAALDCLTLDSVRAVWVSKEHEAATKAGGEELLAEPWYGTKYSVGPLPEEWTTAWKDTTPDDRLHLPAPNPFIPTDLSLKTASQEQEQAAVAAAAAATTMDAPDHVSARSIELAAPVPAAGNALSSGATSGNVGGVSGGVRVKGTRESGHPEVVREVKGRLRLWHMTELRFGQPKAQLYLDFRSPCAYDSPRAAVLSRLFVRLLADYLNEVAYPAQQAGLHYNVTNTQSGWSLTLGGYNHKLRVLMDTVLDKMMSFEVVPERFEYVREAVARDYANTLHQQPYSWAMYRRELLLSARRWPIEQYASIVRSLTPGQLQEHYGRIISSVFVEVMAVGNIALDEALEAADHVAASMEAAARRINSGAGGDSKDSAGEAVPEPSTDKAGRTATLPALAPGCVEEWELPELRTLKVPQAGRTALEATTSGGASVLLEYPVQDIAPGPGGYLFDEAGPSGTDENSAVSVVYQVGPDSLRTNVLTQLLVHLAKRDAFHELRTRQQLGYIVSLFTNAEHGVTHIEFVVQSNAFSAQHLAHSVEAFVAQLLTELLPAKCNPPQPPSPSSQQAQATTESAPASATGAGDSSGSSGTGSGKSEFELGVEELAKAKLEKPKKLSELASKWWREITSGSHVFDRAEAEVAELRRLTPADLMAFAAAVLGPDSPSRRKLTIHTRGTAEAARSAAPAVAASGDNGGSGNGSGSGSGGDVVAAEPSGAAAAAAASTPAAGTAAAPVVISDWVTWKKCCEVWPSTAALWNARRAAATAAAAAAASSSA